MAIPDGCRDPQPALCVKSLDEAYYTTYCEIEVWIEGVAHSPKVQPIHYKPFEPTLVHQTIADHILHYVPVRSLDEAYYMMYCEIQALRDAKDFQIHLFAAQYVQNCIQHPSLFGTRDVTPWECPHQRWEHRIGVVGSPNLRIWASHRLPTFTMPNLPPIGPIMYWNQLGPMGMGKGLTEVRVVPWDEHYSDERGDGAYRWDEVYAAAPEVYGVGH
ncbi:hypothetical protein K438DRAFT_1764307 [Mycena galopus ATCC 62051]|nr:hypothetical protein K438DRAFT_1764307 [Mycena galopus ATCC 62051]